jgi:hypothetical protein
MYIHTGIYYIFDVTGGWVWTKTSDNELREGNERETRGSTTSDEMREMEVKEKTARTCAGAVLAQLDAGPLLRCGPGYPPPFVCPFFVPDRDMPRDYDVFWVY